MFLKDEHLNESKKLLNNASPNGKTAKIRRINEAEAERLEFLDRCAIAAMAALITLDEKVPVDPRLTAQRSYRIARVMLKQRDSES